MKNFRNQKRTAVMYGFFAAAAFLIITGITTAVIPNSYFTRMNPVTTLSYFFLIATSLLIGTIVGLHHFHKQTSTSCTAGAFGGGILGFLAYGCPLCSKLFIFLLGTAGVLTYISPYQPLFGILGISILGVLIVQKIQQIQKSKTG